MSKVWFITGAGSGIGTGIAKASLQAGDRIVATGRNLDKVLNALGDVASEKVAFVQLDVANESQAKAAVAQAVCVHANHDPRSRGRSGLPAPSSACRWATIIPMRGCWRNSNLPS